MAGGKSLRMPDSCLSGIEDCSLSLTAYAEDDIQTASYGDVHIPVPVLQVNAWLKAGLGLQDSSAIHMHVGVLMKRKGL